MASLFKNCYSYYDTKDGQDCPKKIWYLTKAGLVFSAWAGPCWCYSQNYSGALQWAYGIGRVTVPVTSVAATYAASTCLITSARGVDDHLNPIAGSFIAGSLVGAFRNSAHTGFVSGIIFSLAAVSFKLSETFRWDAYFLKSQHSLKERDFDSRKWRWWEPKHPYQEFGSATLWKHDFTLFKDPKDKEKDAQ